MLSALREENLETETTKNVCELDDLPSKKGDSVDGSAAMVMCRCSSEFLKRGSFVRGVNHFLEYFFAVTILLGS
jgi:hypothetical protein